jgi:hypothetical protein
MVPDKKTMIVLSFSFHYLSAPVFGLLFICESMGMMIETPH